MLEEIIQIIILSSFVNVGVMHVVYKLKIDQRLRIVICYFCCTFWLAAFEGALLSVHGIVAIHWILSPVIGLASASLAVYINRGYV